MSSAERNKRYRERHPERVKAWVKNWRRKNREAIRQYEREKYAQMHPEYKAIRLVSLKKWQKENRDKYLEYLRQWRENNKDRIRVTREWHKKKRKSLPGEFTPDDIVRIRTLQRGRCAYCKKKINKKKPNDEHMDHIHPVALGGTNHPSNLQLLCAPCNLRKSAKHPAQFAREIGYLI